MIDTVRIEEAGPTLDAGDLGNNVGFIDLLERTGEEVVFLDWLLARG